MISKIRTQSHLSLFTADFPLSCGFPFFPLDMCHYVIIGLYRTYPLSCRHVTSYNIWTFLFSCRLSLLPADFPLYTVDFPFILQTYPLSCKLPSFLQINLLYCRSFLFPADFPLSCRLTSYTAEVSSFLQTSLLS
jgi:hypothetical protein